MPGRIFFRKSSPWPILLAAAGVLALGAAGAFIALRPLAFHEFSRELALLHGGARRARIGGLVAWDLNLCARGAPCRCVALVHGLGDTALNWDALLLGKRGAAKPPKGARLVAVELPGTEGSREAASYAVPVLADALKQELAPVCPKWTVVGNSLGGWISGWLALKWPEGVERLILLNPAGLEDPTGLSESTARLLADPRVELMRGFPAKAYHKAPLVPERAWPAIVAKIRATPAAAIVKALKREHALDAQAAKIRAPTTVIWGESDRLVGRAVGERYAKLIPDARFVPAPDCGHLPQRECPKFVTDALYATPEKATAAAEH